MRVDTYSLNQQCLPSWSVCNAVYNSSLLLLLVEKGFVRFENSLGRDSNPGFSDTWDHSVTQLMAWPLVQAMWCLEHFLEYFLSLKPNSLKSDWAKKFLLCFIILNQIQWFSLLALAAFIKGHFLAITASLHRTNPLFQKWLFEISSTNMDKLFNSKRSFSIQATKRPWSYF